MPTTKNTQNTALGIRVESGGPQKTYSPGDTVHGVIYRGKHIVAPNANLTVSLRGRSKATLTLGTPGGERFYPSEFNFFETETTAQILWDGPLHVEPGQDEAWWPFSITIPTSLDHSALIKSESRDASYLSLDYGATASLHPPSSFHGGKVGMSGSVDASVEYFISAELKVFAHGSSDVEVATKPVKVKVYRPTIVEDLNLSAKEKTWLAISHRLAPGMENAHLSFSQKTLQAFGSKKVPTFACQVKVEMPTIFQLEGPSHVSVLIQAVPDWEKTTEIIRNVPQKVRLISLNIHIATMTEAIGSGYTSVRTYQVTRNTSLTVDEAMEALGAEVFIPCSADELPLDIGELINLRVGYDGRIGIGQPYLNRNCLFPSFTTFNIKHTHRLGWRLKYSVGDQKGEMEGSQLVAILPPVAPDGDWIQPPPEDDPPPPFAA